jgi:hemerythrin
VATINATLTINAAFLQEIKEDNREFHVLLSDCKTLFLDTMLVSPTGHLLVPATQIVELLSSLRDQIAMHFSLEEAFGYFEDAISVAPRLSDWAEKLRDQHRTLYQEVCNLEEEAEKLCYHELPASYVEVISDHFSQFDRRLERHEADENELIMKALSEDIGAGD